MTLPIPPKYCEDCAVYFRCCIGELHDEMCRALLAVEYGAIHQGEYECPCCTMPPRHHHECALDKALTKAGLDTQEKRDAARKLIGI